MKKLISLLVISAFICVSFSSFFIVDIEAKVNTQANNGANGNKISICHKTSSEKNPWNAIRISTSAWEAHLAHGDFEYEGTDRVPSKAADQWCAKHVPFTTTTTTSTTTTVPPVCGNEIREGNEECDGTDGVTQGMNFCTDTCKLIPIYNGVHVCPNGTEPEVNPVINISISSTDADGSTFGLDAGSYLFKASGEYQFGTGGVRKADAGYGTEDNWVSLRQDLGILEGASHRGVLSLLSNMGTEEMGIVNWGGYNSDHVYYKAYTFDEEKQISFVISDWYADWYNSSYNNQNAMSDNSGELNLEVYKCVPVQPKYTWVQQVHVPSENAEGVTTPKILEAGQLYRLRASGTFTYNGQGDWADAEWYLKNGEIVKGDTEGSVPYVLDVSIDGDVENIDWGNYNAGHIYGYNYMGEGSTIRLFIHDSYYPDNNGYIHIDIYRVNY